MNKKKILLGLVVTTAVVAAGIAGTAVWRYSADETRSVPANNQQAVQPEAREQETVPGTTNMPEQTNIPESADSGTQGWKTYRNEKYGFEFKYPFVLFDKMDTTRVNHIGFFKNNPVDLHIVGIDRISVGIEPTRNSEIGTSEKKALNTFTRLKGQTVYLSGDPVNQIEAIRYELAATPKQSPGGYTYVMMIDNQEYTIAFWYNDEVVYDGKGNKIHELYDPLGDNIMMTFRLLN